MSGPARINFAAQMAASLLTHGQLENAKTVLAQVEFDPNADGVDKESLQGKIALANALSVDYLLDNKQVAKLRQAAELAVTIMAESFEAVAIVILYLCEMHGGRDCDLANMTMIMGGIQFHHENTKAHQRLLEVAHELQLLAA